MYGIKLKVRKAEGDYDPGMSKMLGNPTLPKGMDKEIPGTAMFLMQIRLEELKDIDVDNRLPHTGYLYFFLDLADTQYSMKPIVKYHDGEPDELVGDFNEGFEGLEGATQEYLIEFEKCDEAEPGNRLLGVATDWQFQEEPEGALLFQFDPYEEPGMNLFPTFDGMMYFFFGKDHRDFDAVSFVEDFS